MTPLKKPQIDLISYALKNPYAILAGDTGTGKTRAAIEIKERLGKDALVICPSYQVLNWVDEINLWGPLDSKILAIKSSKDIIDPRGHDYVVVSYDIAKKHEILFQDRKIIFLDEAHNIKSVSAKRTQAIHKFIFENSIEHVYPMSGTILKNRVEEYYANIALTHYDPRYSKSEFLSKFPDNITFADHFSNREEYQIEISGRRVTIVKWSGIKNIDELRECLTGRYIRVKAEKESNPIYKDVMISDMNDAALLDAFNSYFTGEGSEGVDPTAKATAALKKVPITAQYAKDLLEEVGSLVIFSDHVDASNELARIFETKAMNHTVSPHKRMAFAKAFQAGEGRVLVITRALSEGVTLTRSNHLILNDYPWVPGDLKQVKARIDRLGQTKTCVFHRMIGSPQDHKIMKAIEDKTKIIDIAT